MWMPSTAIIKYRITVEGLATPSNNVIKNMHFFVYKKLRQAWALKIKENLLDQQIDLNGILPIENAFIVVHRYCSGDGLDWDNAYGGLKPMLDCLTVAHERRNPNGLGLIRDDNPQNMPVPPYVTQQKSKRKETKTLIEIYELNNA